MKLAYITGASSGLGKAMAETFLEMGYEVRGISRNKDIEHSNYKHIFMDLSREDEYSKFSFPSMKGYEELIFINNAGTVSPVKMVGKLSMPSVVSAFHLNFLSVVFFVNLLKNIRELPVYILNISSGAADYPVQGWSVYCSTKAALNAFSKVVVAENPYENMQVRCIAPGIIDTPMQEQIRKSKKEDFREVDRFKDYKKSGDLQSAEETAKKIIRNFKDLFKSDQVLHSFREL